MVCEASLRKGKAMACKALRELIAADNDDENMEAGDEPAQMAGTTIVATGMSMLLVAPPDPLIMSHREVGAAAATANNKGETAVQLTKTPWRGRRNSCRSQCR